MRDRSSRIKKSFILAAASVIPAASIASAAVYDDSANGVWDSDGTWTSADAPGTAPTGTANTITVDSNTVTASYTAFTGGTVNIATGGTLVIPTSYTGTNSQPTTLNLQGGTLDGGRMTLHGATAINITGTTNKLRLTSATETFQLGGEAVIAGDGTLTVEGRGKLQFGSAYTGSNTNNNTSTFSGTYVITTPNFADPGQPAPTWAESFVIFGAPQQSRFATVELRGGKLAFNYAGTTDPARGVVTNLTGTGTIHWTNSGYSRDLQVSGYIDPGFEGVAGTIKRSPLSPNNTSMTRNDLIFSTGADVVMDVFSSTSADKIEWKDASNISGMVFNTADLVVKLFTPAANATEAQTGTAASPLSWTLIDADEWIDVSNDSSSTPAAIANQAFASVAIRNASGASLDLWDGTEGDTGWTLVSGGGSGVDYVGTSGSSNRGVVLSAWYHTGPVTENISLTNTGNGDNHGNVILPGAGENYVVQVLDLAADPTSGFVDLFHGDTSTPWGETPTIVLLDTNGEAIPAGITLNGATVVDAETFNLLNAWAGGGFDVAYSFADAGSKFNFDLGSVALDRIAVVPEPATLGLAGLSLAGLLRPRRRKA